MEATVEFAEAEVPGLSLGHAVLDLAVRDLAAGQGLDLRVSAMSGTAGAFGGGQFVGQGGGCAGGSYLLRRGRRLLGARSRSISTSRDGQALADGPTLITVEAASASVGQEHLALGRPVEMRVDPGGGLAVGELDLRLAGGGRLGGAGTWQADGLQGHVSGTRVPLTLLGHLTEVPVAAGSLDIEAAFDTRRQGARAEIEARARDILLTGVEAEQALAAELSGHWDGARLNLQAVLRGSFGEPAEARLTLPVRVGDDGLPHLFRQDAIDGSLSWRGAMADLWQLLPPSAHVAEGDVDLQVRVAGTADAPRLSGHAEWSRGRYDHVECRACARRCAGGGRHDGYRRHHAARQRIGRRSGPGRGQRHVALVRAPDDRGRTARGAGGAAPARRHQRAGQRYRPVAGTLGTISSSGGSLRLTRRRSG